MGCLVDELQSCMEATAWISVSGASRVTKFFTRDARPGKTGATGALPFVGLGYGSFWRGVIFDTEYKNLTDIITQSKRMYRLFNDGARYLASASELRWVWPTGEELLFRFGKEE
jgi:hypothetical protein